MAPNNSLVLKTNLNPSITLSHVFFSPRLFKEGFRFSLIKKREESIIKNVITVNVPVIPKPAIKKPPTACPVTEAESHVPWFHVVAFCKVCFGTM